MIVSILCDRYLKEYAPLKKERSQVEDARIIRAYVRPALGQREVGEIQWEDIGALHKSLKSTPYQANRVLSLLSKLFALAEKWRLRPPGSNPCRGTPRYREVKRSRYITEDEAPKLAALLSAYEGDRPLEVAFIYLLLLSGARPDEIRRAQWDWLELAGDGAVLRLPDSKTGARPIYLSPKLARLLGHLERSDVRILAGARPEVLWRLIRASAGFPDLRLYDLRHTFASAALAAGYTLDQIGELLGHKTVQTTKRYAHLLEGKAHEIAAGTSAKLEAMLSA